MTACGLVVLLEAARHHERWVERFLEGTAPLIRAEARSDAWFAVRFTEHHFGMFDAFPDDAAREAHLRGPVAQSLEERSALFAAPPQIERVEILADKRPRSPASACDRKALLLTLVPQLGREAELADVLRSAQLIVEDEPDTTAWFALRFENGNFGIFDVFPDGYGRARHLLGKVPRELVRHVRLLGAMPRMSMGTVQAEAFA